MTKKKFYISDIPSVTNALNMMTSTYDKNFKSIDVTTRRLGLAIIVTAGSVWLLNKIVKDHNSRIRELEAEVKNLKSKEGNQMTEGE